MKIYYEKSSRWQHNCVFFFVVVGSNGYFLIVIFSYLKLIGSIHLQINLVSKHDVLHTTEISTYFQQYSVFPILHTDIHEGNWYCPYTWLRISTILCYGNLFLEHLKHIYAFKFLYNTIFRTAAIFYRLANLNY